MNSRLLRLLAGCCLLLVAPGTQATTATPTVRPPGDLGTREIHGRVFDASRGPGAAIAAARIDYWKHSLVNPAVKGSTFSDASGAFAFSLFLHDTDSISIRVSAIHQGFYPNRLEYGGLLLWYAADPIEVPLEPGFCAGDCDRNGRVAIDELILGVGIALGARTVGLCDAVDANIDAEASIAELVAAVEHALRGCGIATPVPTPTPTACGDAGVTQRFARCQASESETDCAAAGGTWGTYPFSGIEGCFCPTGQGGCACTRASDCVGWCFSADNAFGDRCRTARQGVCSAVEPQAGCRCTFDEDGNAYGLCIDP